LAFHVILRYDVAVALPAMRLNVSAFVVRLKAENVPPAFIIPVDR
jgi:hypothetical protein